MQSKFLPVIKTDLLKLAIESENYDNLYDILTQPLHEELYKRQSFEFLDELSEGQKLLLMYDYLIMQVNQGGFIQFIHNGYFWLLPDMIKCFTDLNANNIAKLLDDVLKVFVLNKELFLNAVTLEQFTNLYKELEEFVELDSRFVTLNIPMQKLILDYARMHIEDFAILQN